ncbi:hypothetical protein [Halothiobacillus sp.]|uniref:hypothetical protein n=1 Tax=Halothiobacillus sp. TaxID=1891311 RepID=UPI003D14DC7E
MNQENEQVTEETATFSPIGKSIPRKVTIPGLNQTKKVSAELDSDMARRYVVIEAKIGTDGLTRKERDQTIVILGIQAVEFALNQMEAETGKRLPDLFELSEWLESKLKG